MTRITAECVNTAAKSCALLTKVIPSSSIPLRRDDCGNSASNVDGRSAPPATRSASAMRHRQVPLSTRARSLQIVARRMARFLCSRAPPAEAPPKRACFIGKITGSNRVTLAARNLPRGCVCGDRQRSRRRAAQSMTGCGARDCSSRRGPRSCARRLQSRPPAKQSLLWHR